MYVKRGQYNPLVDLLDSIYNAMSRPAQATGSRKVDEAHADGYKSGLIEGLCRGAANYVTQARLERYPLFEMVAICGSHEIQSLFRMSDGVLWKAGDQLEMETAAIRSDKDLDAEEKNARLTELNIEYYHTIEAAIEILIAMSEESVASHEETRRQKIISGELAPEPSDAEWLTEAIREQENRQKNLRDILNRTK